MVKFGVLPGEEFLNSLNARRTAYEYAQTVRTHKIDFKEFGRGGLGPREDVYSRACSGRRLEWPTVCLQA